MTPDYTPIVYAVREAGFTGRVSGPHYHCIACKKTFPVERCPECRQLGRGPSYIIEVLIGKDPANGKLRCITSVLPEDPTVMVDLPNGSQEVIYKGFTLGLIQEAYAGMQRLKNGCQPPVGTSKVRSHAEVLGSKQ